MEVPEVKRLRSLDEDNARLRKLLAEAMLDKKTLCPKALTTDQKREAEEVMCEAASLSQRRACRLACHFHPADIKPSVRQLTRNCLDASQNWHLNAGDLVTGASGSYCAGRAFTLTTSGFTASITF